MAISPFEQRIIDQLRQREEHGLLRQLSAPKGLIDFASNDYLGFARLLKVKLYDDSGQDSGSEKLIGSTGSRLLTGNSPEAVALEAQIAAFHNAPSALLFNSGYDANIGLFSSLPQAGDTIIYDALIHASIHDGIRLSKAAAYRFRHNDLDHLRQRLQLAEGQAWVAVESIYSMDGDLAPLREMTDLCREFDAVLIVDEAHATGIFGNGAGRVVELGLEAEIPVRLHTFGKALGCHGAAVVCPENVRTFLLNFARSLIYTTALPNHSVFAAKSAYDKLSLGDFTGFESSGIQNLFQQKIKDYFRGEATAQPGPIQAIFAPGNDRCKALAQAVQAAGFDVRPILSPTVPKGTERLRICLHTFNTENELDGLLEAIAKNR